MDIQIIAQTIIYGIFAGSTYSLVAVGLQWIFGITKIINIAHGPLVVIGSYLTFYAFSLCHLDPFAAILPVTLILLLLGLVVYCVIFYPLKNFVGHERVHLSLLLAFGLMIILQNGAQLLWTADERTLTTWLTGASLEFIGVRLPYVRLAGLAVALLVIIGVHLLLIRTYFGKSVRALIDNPQAARLVGVNINLVHLLSFGLGIALAGSAGTLVAVTTSFSPFGGMVWTLKGLIVVVLAGTGNIRGVFFAGLLLGVVEAFGATVGMGAYREIFGLVTFVLVLMFKPEGLFVGGGRAA